MKNTQPEDLFKKYTAGNCSEDEKALVEAWYLSQLKENTSRPSDVKIQKAKDEAWKVIMPVKTFRTSIYLWSAAAAVLTAVLALFFFQSVKTDESAHSKLANVSSKSAPILKGTLLEASKVENSLMKLPDGSTVILEKGTTLTLSPDFNKSKTREVVLQGKAFFDIYHDANRRFIIHSGNVKTTVLGTAFDVTARPGSRKVTVNVIRGRVKVEDNNTHWVTILPKNYQVEFVDTEVPRRIAVNAAKELAWKQADLEFTDVSLGDAQPRFEEQFGYKMDIGDTALKNTTFTYSMRKKEAMESFIKGMCAFIGASYTIDNKNKIISIQPLNQ